MSPSLLCVQQTDPTVSLKTVGSVFVRISIEFESNDSALPPNKEDR